MICPEAKARLAGQPLSAREYAIVARLCSHREPTVPVVAEELNISLTTAKESIKLIHCKLQVSTRVGMTHWAIRNGVVTL